MNKFYRTLAISGMLAVFSVSLTAPTFAGTTGRRNTAIALTAATAYSVLKKNDRAALLGGLASAQAWKGYEDSRKRDSRQKSSSYSRASYANYSRPATRTYARPAVYRTTSSSASSSGAAQLKANVEKLEAQNAELRRQAEINRLKAEIVALANELAQQRGTLVNQSTEIADTRSSMSTFHTAITAVVILLAIGLMFGVSKLSRIRSN
jgi:hypothetical protein